MFYLILRCLYDEYTDRHISRDEYIQSVERLARIHGIKKNGIRN